MRELGATRMEGAALKAALKALVVLALHVGGVVLLLSNVGAMSISGRSLQEYVLKWQPFSVNECQAALLLMFLSGLSFVHELRSSRTQSAWCSLCARLPPVSCLKIKRFNGTVHSVPFERHSHSDEPVLGGWLRRRARLLALWPTVAAARTAARAADQAAIIADRVNQWRRSKNERWWRSLTLGTQLFYLLFAILSNRLPSPESILTSPAPTPSQLATNPFLSVHAHSAHLEPALEHLLSFGPRGFDSLLATPPQCNVTLDFSLLDAHAPQIVLDSVPASETVQSIMSVAAAVMGVPVTDVGMLYDEFSSPNPLTPLAALSRLDGCVELQVIPRNRVGGDCADTPGTSSNPHHPGRQRADEQPPPVFYPNRHEKTKWYCKAKAYKERTGNAKGKWDLQWAEWYGPSEEDVLRHRERWLYEFEHPKQKAAPTGKRFAPNIPKSEPRAKRVAAPDCLAEPKLQPSGGTHAGPGRGRTFEPAAAKGSSSSILEEPVQILAAKSTNWLAQASQRKQWQTDRIKQLEDQLAAALCREQEKDCIIEQQAQTIAQLQARVRELEVAERQLARELLSHLPTDAAVREVSTAKALLGDPQWNAVLGVGYRNDQKKSLVYQHVKKLLDRTHEITGGDPLKAQYLADLM
jgi:hypothetical protein